MTNHLVLPLVGVQSAKEEEEDDQQIVKSLLGIEPFCGELVDAFNDRQRTRDGSRLFSSISKFLDISLSLGEDVELSTGEATLFGVSVALFGPDSDFRRRLITPAVAEVSPIEILHGSPWCGAATARFMIPVPVLGAREFAEDLRIAISFVDAGQTTLAVQFSSKLALGFPVGDCVTETLHILTQDDLGGPVRLRSLGLAPPGRFEEKALAGIREARRSFVETAKSHLERAASDILQLQLPSVARKLLKAAGTDEDTTLCSCPTEEGPSFDTVTSYTPKTEQADGSQKLLRCEEVAILRLAPA